MAITIAELCERVFYRLGMPTTEPAKELYLYQIESYIPAACQDLAEQAVNGEPTPRQYLTKEYTVPNVGGVYPLTGAGFADLLLESLPVATLTHADSEWPLERLASPADLRFPQAGEDNGELIYYAVQARTLRTRFNAEVDALTGDITIEDGVFQPVVGATSGDTTLPVQLEDELIEELLLMCREKLGAGAPQA